MQVDLDTATPELLFGMFVGHPGRFLLGCCAERPTTSCWSLWSSNRRVGMLSSGCAFAVGLWGHHCPCLPLSHDSGYPDRHPDRCHYAFQHTTADIRAEEHTNDHGYANSDGDAKAVTPKSCGRSTHRGG